MSIGIDREETNRRNARVELDIKRIRDTPSWPWGKCLPLKSQPWVGQEHRKADAGLLWLDDLNAKHFVVRVFSPTGRRGDELEKFESIEALANKWSVD